jgi:D-3-phosphoglycerate dehydrogenase
MTKVLLIEPTIQMIGVDTLTSEVEVVMAPDGEEDTLISYLTKEKISAVITRIESITQRVIEQATYLKVIGQHGVGVDNIDVNAATQNGILVVNAPTSNHISTAEHAVMMILALSRRLPDSDKSVRNGDFQFRERFFPTEINGKVLFVVGLGRIGAEVAKKCRLAFNMEVIAYDPNISEIQMAGMGVKKVTLDAGLKAADFVCIHAPLSKNTQHMISERELSLMKTDSFLINLARGGIIKQDALVKALEAKQIKGAGLDVFDPEPPPSGDQILSLPNVILTPHFAGDTYEAKQRCSESIAREVLTVLNGRLPVNIVNPNVFSNPNFFKRWLGK